MNQASRWRTFIAWWNNYIPQQGEDVYEVVTKKVEEIKETQSDRLKRLRWESMSCDNGTDGRIDE